MFGLTVLHWDDDQGSCDEGSGRHGFTIKGHWPLTQAAFNYHILYIDYRRFEFPLVCVVISQTNVQFSFSGRLHTAHRQQSLDESPECELLFGCFSFTLMSRQICPFCCLPPVLSAAALIWDAAGNAGSLTAKELKIETYLLILSLGSWV